ncbi:MAG: hypothetical protein VX492_03650 [Candidatus Thermoplasmatota archaeon]|nr:hypothetical protein [Candidatus Thermoplasmatota archaeon]
MVPAWPFRKKKPAKPSISRTKFVKNVVEYERKSRKDSKAADEETHLKDRKFLDAMKILSKKDD